MARSSRHTPIATPGAITTHFNHRRFSSSCKHGYYLSKSFSTGLYSSLTPGGQLGGQFTRFQAVIGQEDQGVVVKVGQFVEDLMPAVVF